MSLTGAYHIFAGLDQQGTNKALQAFFGARPHYLHYGSVPFVAASSVSVTQVPPIAFPGVPGGIPYAIDLTVPAVDLYPPDGALPPPLALGPDQLSIETEVTITLGCMAGTQGQKGHVTPVRTTLKVIAIAHPVSHYFSPGVGYVSFQVDEVLLVERGATLAAGRARLPARDDPQRGARRRPAALRPHRRRLRSSSPWRRARTSRTIKSRSGEMFSDARHHCRSG